jgi:hypothetical protein
MTDAGRSVGVHGVEKLHLAVGIEETSALHVLRQVGFSPVGSDVVLGGELHAIALRVPGRPAVNAGRELADEVANLAAGAAGRSAGDVWSEYPVGGWVQSVSGLRSLVGGDGAVEAAWRIFAGKHGVWLHLVSFAAADPAAVAATALHECAEARAAGPLYCAVPESSESLRAALHEAGLDTVVRRAHLAKPTAALVIEPAWDLRGASERALDPAKAGPT